MIPASVPPAPAPQKSVEPLRAHLDRRLAALRPERDSFLRHWRDLSAYILPRRGRWLATPNQTNRGSPINQRILDSTAGKAVQTLTAGLMAGMSSPARPWFRLTVSDDALADKREVKIWLFRSQKKMLRIFAKSNLYIQLSILYEELAVFGTGILLIEDDHQDLVRFTTLTVGEYFVANGPRGIVDTLYREFTMSVGQMVGRFGLDAVSDIARGHYLGGRLDQECVVCHAIEPNDKRVVSAPGAQNMAFRSVYWESAGPKDRLLSIGGYSEFPACCPRWHLTAGDAYGRSPGMDALGDIKSLQVEQKTKAQGIVKVVKPAMLADSQLKDATTEPDTITYLPNANGVGFKPVYQVNLPLGDLVADIREVQQRIRECFFADLFLMISQLDTVRTATEISERRQEKMLQLGPVLERLLNELFDPLIERTFAILKRHSVPCWARGEDGPLPQVPAELHDIDLDIDYVSTLSDAQKAVDTTGVERLVGFVGNLAAAMAEVLDGIDFDEVVTVYADMLGVPPTIIRSAAQIAETRSGRAKAASQAQAAQTAMAAVQGAQTLSQTDVGGGQNALQRMIGGAP